MKSEKKNSFMEVAVLGGIVLAIALPSVIKMGSDDTAFYHQVLARIESERTILKPKGTSPACFNPDNVGTVGTAAMKGCVNMLIVDTAMLRSASSPATGDGDESYGFLVEEDFYSFDDNMLNIFTGQVTDMSSLFEGTSFSGNIGYWDTSQVKTMARMFADAKDFNARIGGWSVGAVQTMRSMFEGADRFNSEIGAWNVSSVEDFHSAFKNASSFNQDIGSWDTSQASDMTEMFFGAGRFAKDLSQWDVSNVTAHSSFFDGSGLYPSFYPTWTK